jgi:hypothetical protein
MEARPRRKAEQQDRPRRAIGYVRVSSVVGRSGPEYHTLDIQRARASASAASAAMSCLTRGCEPAAVPRHEKDPRSRGGRRPRGLERVAVQPVLVPGGDRLQGLQEDRRHRPRPSRPDRHRPRLDPTDPGTARPTPGAPARPRQADAQACAVPATHPAKKGAPRPRRNRGARPLRGCPVPPQILGRQRTSALRRCPDGYERFCGAPVRRAWRPRTWRSAALRRALARPALRCRARGGGDKHSEGSRTWGPPASLPTRTPLRSAAASPGRRQSTAF